MPRQTSPAVDRDLTPFDRLRANERGATAVEYGLNAALVSLACVMAFLSLGINLSELFFGISNSLSGR
ncbi:pilus assembly protein Flp/PilA [Sphingobium sp. B2D3B]|uniref:Flp family type IVb pilin n=1 Tax=Sphingobium sp. B2D3B TaxID=2940580 RepID=UPI002224B2FE|nr:Flp family type IVb pilin [Sphingobium sp. B2D3B]MCW2380899.1 pilus assembly protein Flp/PilA [Sphingobium sp. B2D3B]